MSIYCIKLLLVLQGSNPELYQYNKRRLTASDCQEGNRRDCNISNNQASGKERGVQYVMAVVCLYVCMLDIVYV